MGQPPYPPQHALAGTALLLEDLQAMGISLVPRASLTRRTSTPNSSGTRVLFCAIHPGITQPTPFSAEEDQLLQTIVEKGMGLSMKVVQLLQAGPGTEAVQALIQEIRPELTILCQKTPSASLGRGEIQTTSTGHLLGTAHPSSLLANPSLKAACWEDIQIGMHFLNPSPTS